MNIIKIERLRGMIQASPSKLAVTLDVVPVEGGFELHCADQRLESRRGGDVRVFRTIDSAYNYASKYLVQPGLRHDVDLRVRAQHTGTSLF